MAQIPSTNSRPTSSGNALSPKQSRSSPILRPAALNTSSPHASTPIQSPPRKDSSLQPSPSVSHRSSFAENLRNYPPSPRAQRTHSFSGQALTDLLMGPTVKGNGGEARFSARDWRSVQVGEIIDPAEVRF
ncbi:hypothetical protein B0A55_12906, partial [Friedmanniomyces simplex]